jgi:HK97 family phage major capsid protein
MNKKVSKKMEEASDLLAKLTMAKVAKMQEKKEKEESKKTKKSIGLTKEMVDEMSGKQRTKQFISALLLNDKEKLKILSTSVNADGGFLVPAEWYNRIVEEKRDISDIRNRATVIEDCPPTFYIDQLESRPNVYWRGELTTKDTSTASFTQISLTPYSLAVIVALSKELAADATVGIPEGIVNYITKLIVTSLAEEEEKRFVMGTGATQPTGIDAYAATIARSVTTGAGVADSDTLIAATLRLGQQYLQNAVWIMNSECLRRVMQLKDSQNRYLFLPDPTGKTPGTILGRPIIRNDSLNQTRAWLIDLKGYYIGVRGGISVMQSEEAYITPTGSAFEKNLIYIRVEERLDAELADLHCACVVNGM